MAKKLLILEAEWKNEAVPHFERWSVLPLMDSVCRLVDTRIYYYTFSDREDIERHIDLFCNDLRAEDRAIIYFAAHGSNRFICGARQINFGRLADIINHKIRASQSIEGCIIGACETGNHDDGIRSLLARSPLRWVVGYKHEVDWVEGTMVDALIVSKVFGRKKRSYEEKERTTEFIRSWFSMINPNGIIAGETNGEECRAVTASETLVVHYQLAGQGHRVAKLEEHDLFPDFPAESD